MGRSPAGPAAAPAPNTKLITSVDGLSKQIEDLEDQIKAAKKLIAEVSKDPEAIPAAKFEKISKKMDTLGKMAKAAAASAADVPPLVPKPV
jgi:peptidoglycan hydrolase CwlO-like protein